MTQSEPVPQDHLNDPFEDCMKVLSEIPTERAMKDLQYVKSSSVRKVVETMAIQKADLVKCLRLMRLRELLLQKKIEMLEKSSVIDGTLSKLLKEHGNDYDIVFHDKAN